MAAAALGAYLGGNGALGPSRDRSGRQPGLLPAVWLRAGRGTGQELRPDLPERPARVGGSAVPGGLPERAAAARDAIRDQEQERPRADRRVAGELSRGA